MLQILAFVSVFGKSLSRKSTNVVVFPFAFHIAVQQTFKAQQQQQQQLRRRQW